MVLSQHLGNADIVFGGFDTSRISGENFGFSLKLVNGRFDTCDDGTSPADRAGGRWHILRNRRALLVHLKKFFHIFDLIIVATHNVLILVLEAAFNFLACFHVSKLGKKVKGTLGRAEAILKGVINDCCSFLLKVNHCFLELLVSSNPNVFVFA